MKIAYLVYHKSLNIDGPLKKAFVQASEWDKLGNSVKIFLVCLGNFDSSKIGYNNVVYLRIKNTLSYFFIMKITLQKMKEFCPDILYMRPNTYLPYLISLYKYKPTVYEINASERSELMLKKYKSIYYFLKYWYLIFTYSFMYKYIKGFVLVNHKILEKPDFNIDVKKSIVIPNSINVQNYQKRNIQKENPIPQLVFMGSKNQPWHGIDILMNIAKLSEEKLFFNIIGPFSDNKNSRNIKFWGNLEQSEYEKIILKCDIGVGTLAFKKYNMLGCPLKVREYLAYGLPIIIGYEDPSFVLERPDWIYCDENIFNNYENTIGNIIKFCYKYKNYIVKNDLLYDRIDSASLEKKRIEFFRKFIQNT